MSQAQHDKTTNKGPGKTLQLDRNHRPWRLWITAVAVVLIVSLLWWFIHHQKNGPLNHAVSEPATDTTVTNSIESGHSANSEELNQQTDTLHPPVPATSIEDMQNLIEEQAHLSITGKPIDPDSVSASQQLLLNELKGKKRTISPSTMGPLMALEYEQFGRYLDNRQFDAADQLLTEMQESWPEFDYEDMIYRLAMAEAKTE